VKTNISTPIQFELQNFETIITKYVILFIFYLCDEHQYINGDGKHQVLSGVTGLQPI